MSSINISYSPIAELNKAGSAFLFECSDEDSNEREEEEFDWSDHAFGVGVIVLLIYMII